MKRLSQYLGQCTLVTLALLSVLGGLGACSSNKLPSLSLNLEPTDSTDTVLHVTYEGKDSVWRDSMPLQAGKPILLQPDTSRLKAIFLSHEGYRKSYCYTLRGGAWTLTLGPPPALPLDTLDTVGIYQLSGVDARGKHRDMYELLRKGRVAVIFSSLALQTHHPADRDSLLKRFPKDSLELLYLMLTPSDSAALARLKHDTLDKKTAIVFSDTLSLVSRMRSIYGISRDPSPRIFIVDSLGQVMAYPPK